MAGCNGLGEGHGVEVNGAHFFWSQYSFLPSKILVTSWKCVFFQVWPSEVWLKVASFFFTSFPEGNSRRSVVVANEERKGKSSTVVYRKKQL